MLATKRLYFEGTYKLQCSAQIVAVGAAPISGKPDDPVLKPFIVLDQTVCHPQGGGQPSDVATITSTTSGAVFHVTDVRNDKDRVQILHFGQLTEQDGTTKDIAELFAVGSTVSLSVDEAARRHHARLHSAGHLLDSALSRLGVLQQYGLKPTKGYHFPSGPNVEYSGVIPPAEVDSVQKRLQEEMARLIQEDASVEVFLDVPAAKIAELCCTTDFEPEEEEGEDKGGGNTSLSIFPLFGLILLVV